MVKFLIILGLIFAAFYFGGAILFDSGIAGNSSKRIPAAVQAEEFYNEVNKTVGKFAKTIDLYIAPARNILLKQTSNVLEP